MLDVAAGSNPMHCRPARPMRRGRPRRREAAGDLPGSSVAQPRGEVHLVAGRPLLAGDEPDAPTLALSWRSARFASPGPSSVAPPERSSSQAWWLSFRSTTSPARQRTTGSARVWRRRCRRPSNTGRLLGCRAPAAGRPDAVVGRTWERKGGGPCLSTAIGNNQVGRRRPNDQRAQYLLPFAGNHAREREGRHG